MAHPCLIAGVAAVFSIASLAFSFDASARSGGGGFGRGGGGHAGGGHVGLHRGFAPPFAHGRNVHRHVGRHHGRHGDHRRDGKRLRDREDVGLALPSADGGYVGPWPDSSLSGAGDPNTVGSRVFYRHVCRADTQTVRSGRGGETEVTVTRCYMVAE